MIEFKNIYFRFDDKLIFENFSAKIEKGQKVAIVGESGSGKSTFLNLLAGFEIPNSGQISFDRILLTHKIIEEIRQKFAWLPQNFNVPFETINELFYSVFSIKSNKKIRPSKNKIVEIFSLFGISTKLMEKKINEVSGGQKQRIMLASILLTNKKYIFLDEPTSALDEASANKMIEVLFNLEDTTVIVATHDKLFLEKADKIIDLSLKRKKN